MSSRLLETLAIDAQAAKSPESWSRALCRSAIHLARQGSHADAQFLITRVRTAYGKDLHIDVAAWVMLAEGVLHFSKAEMFQAYDRIRRGYGLAIALQTETARPTCAAWMAFLEFNGSKFDEMFSHLKEALTDAPKEDHGARGRACGVVADAYQVAGRYDCARIWYERTRLHATAEGDQATLSAMLYNVAVFRTANLRLADAFGGLKSADVLRATMEADSSLGYDYAVGKSTFVSLGPMMYGQLLAIEKNFIVATKLLDQIIEKNLQPPELTLLLCERAWCYAQLGRIDEASLVLGRATAGLSTLQDNDDIAFGHARLAAVADLCGEQNTASVFRSIAHQALAAHQKFQATLHGRLELFANALL